MTLKLNVCMLAVVACLLGVSASAQSVWSVSSDVSTSDGDGYLCNVWTEWPDGRYLSIWLNQHQYFGFSLVNSNWSLPQDLESFVTFSFRDGSQHTFALEAVSETHALGSWDTSDGAEFLQRFARYWQMDVIFPQGDSWAVSLAGSNAALQQWFQCAVFVWDNAAGSSGANPFGQGGGSRSNPFQ